MKAWLPVMRERLGREAAVIRVTVATVRGSAPREPGACMLIGTQRIDGTIGGGHLELKATEIAREMLAAPDQSSRLDRFALGATLGQCCGGAVNLWFDRYENADRRFVEESLAVSRVGEPVIMLTLPQAGGGMRRSLHTSDGGRSNTSSVTAAIEALLKAPPDAARALLVSVERQEALLERIDPEGLPLWLFGAGHVGKALVNVLADLPFNITWIDSRREEFPAALSPEVNVRVAEDPAALLREAPRNAYFLVMTHSHDLDFALCREILLRNDFAFAGLIGSETKAACFNLRFGRENIPAESVARLVSPIGVAGIDSKLPGAIAVAVAAQLLQVAQAAQQSVSIPAKPRLREVQTA
jgi:xanthine dehydrogenase accessory factor